MPNATFVASQARLQIGEHEHVADLAPLDLELVIESYDPFELEGRAVAGQISARADFVANLQNLEAAELYLPENSRLGVREGEAAAHRNSQSDAG